MTRDERTTAFALRQDGATWEEIGEELGYDSSTVRKDLLSAIQCRPPGIIYPAAERLVVAQYNGSINEFARHLRVSPHRLRQVLLHGAKPSESLLDKIEAGSELRRGDFEGS